MRNHQEPPTCSLRVNREEWSKNEKPQNGHEMKRTSSSMYQSIFLQLNVVHWNPLCWGILLALKWGFYHAQVESYSHLKNAWRATRHAWRATMVVGNQRWCASVSPEKEVVFNLLCRRALVFRQGELAQMVERSLSMREVAGSMPAFSS